jgi:hypothetical protein
MAINLEKKLARLRGQETPASTISRMNDPNENHEVRAWVRKRIADMPESPSIFDDPKTFVPTDPAVREAEMYAQYATQPENEYTFLGRVYDWSTFYIGRPVCLNNLPSNKYAHFSREAIPRPRFENPGAPATMKMWTDFNREENLWFTASNALAEVISLITSRELKPDYFFDEKLGQPERLETQKAFLLGVWNGRGLTPPTDEQIATWLHPVKPTIIPEGHRLVEYVGFCGIRLYQVEPIPTNLVVDATVEN